MQKLFCIALVLAISGVLALSYAEGNPEKHGFTLPEGVVIVPAGEEFVLE